MLPRRERHNKPEPEERHNRPPSLGIAIPLPTLARQRVLHGNVDF